MTHFNPRHREHVLTRDQVRRIDRLAIESLGIPGVVLMENAGLHVASLILDLLTTQQLLEPRASRVAILCGGGNNGGDGYVVARQLHNWGVAVTIYAAKDPDALKGDAAINARICQRMGLHLLPIMQPAQIAEASPRWARAHVVVDALLGTGFEGQVHPPLTEIIERVNQLQGPAVVAVDIPSGLDCQTGRPSPVAIRAHHTVTLVARKTGFDSPEAEPYLGQVSVASIGAPPELIDQVIEQG